MSVLIRGMEMPENCSVCWALDDYGDYPRCRITEEQRGYNFPIREKRMGKCPLVPVPLHGDLIDRDALMEEFRLPKDLLDPAQVLMHITGVRAVIQTAPTIIQAEGGE